VDHFLKKLRKTENLLARLRVTKKARISDTGIQKD
jgi:hypothetical protein